MVDYTGNVKRDEYEIVQYRINKAEQWANSLLIHIHYMQRDIAYMKEGVTQEEKLNAALSYQKELMEDGILYIADFLGFEIVKKEQKVGAK